MQNDKQDYIQLLIGYSQEIAHDLHDFDADVEDSFDDSKLFSD